MDLTGPCEGRDNGSCRRPKAGVTQLVECDLAKVDVAGSNPVSRSIPTDIYLKHSSHPLHFYTSIMYM